MPRSWFSGVLRALIVVVLASSLVRSASARTSREGASSGPTVSTPVAPLPDERVAESIARFEVAPGPGATDVRIVVARVPFDPTRWSSLPAGPAWTIVPYGGAPVALAPLGLADRTDTRLWWAVVWTDVTGALRASEARAFTLVPRFANRVAPDGVTQPSASGRLPEFPAATAPTRTVELAAGYTLVPGSPAPQIPARLARAVHYSGAAGAARGAYLVEFADDSPDSARARIGRAGGTLVSAIGSAAYLVRMGTDEKARLDAGTGNPWSAPYEPAYKLSRALEVESSGTVDVTALLFSDGDDDGVAAALRALGATNVASHRGPLNHLARFELDRARLADAAALADVAWLEPSPHDSTSNDQAQWVVQSGVANSRPVWDHGIRGQGQVVMTSDSGIRANHEMFNDSTQAINGFGDYPTHRKIIAYQPGSDDPHVAFGDNVESDYHGTHTAGTVAGSPDPYSTAPWSGMAKDAKLYFMDLSGPTGANGIFPPADLNDLYQRSYTGNSGGAARIASNSWGAFAQGAYTISSMQVDQFMWNHPDYLIAFASGNVGVFSSVQSPATAKNILTVGATGNGTLQNTLANFSSRGPAADGRRKPTLVAPGDYVTSSVGSTRYSYATYSGTSMATPAVAGAMALMREYVTEGWYPTGAPVAANAFDPSAALLKAMAVAAARNDVISFRAPDNSIGYGRLTIDDVLYFPGDSSRTVLIDPQDGLENGQYIEYQVQVTDPTRPLKIALCWTDAPGNPTAAVQLVNDLDLVVINGANTYLGNYLLNNVSKPGGIRDSLNVEEFVRLPTPAAGLWTVRVAARRVLQGPQRFALCVTGGVGGSAGAVALDRFQYGLSDTLGIEVIDGNASSPLTATVTSSTESWSERVRLTGSHGIFHGAIPIAPVESHPGDGVLSVSSGDLVTVTYSDVSPALQVSASARVNVQAPTITDVHATALSATQAVVTWTTDLTASTRVHFGATAAVAAIADSSGYTTQHAVLLTGLQPGSITYYDVESVARGGESTRDSLGGAHRTFSTKRAGSLALLLDDPSANVRATWTNAFTALGWDADILPAAANDPPLVGNTSAGLRSYNAVLWQVNQNNYPAFSDAQRTAIDSLLNGGGRLLVTGHDIGFSLSDAGAPSYTPEREAWIESGLKTRYYADNYNADTLSGVVGDPITGTSGAVPYADWIYPDAGDNVDAAPGTDGVWTGIWTENFYRNGYIGMRWQSNTPKGVSGTGVWGGEPTRLVGLFYEWRALAGTATTNLDARTNVLRQSVSWLLGHAPPVVQITSPQPGSVVSADYLPIQYTISLDSDRAITSRVFEYSLDGGETWLPLTTTVCGDGGCIWDLGAVLGGTPTANTTRALLRMRVTDDGTPSLQTTATMSGTFTLARSSGDQRGPVLVAGSLTCSPMPILRGAAATLFATVSDAETGGGNVIAVEYSVGAAAAPAGQGTPMSGSFGNVTAQATAALATASVDAGGQTLWVRARDAAGNWGTAGALTVPTIGAPTTGVGDERAVDFLAPPSPNPLHGSAAIRFGLSRAGDVKLELYDLAGRRVRTLASGVLAPGTHISTWDGRDEHGAAVGAGVYFVRLVTPGGTFKARVVALR